MMSVTRKKQADWLAIQGSYIAGQLPLRTIADRHGITEGAIRARAKKFGWVRNAPETKRRIVAARMAGITQDVAQNALRNVENAASQDVADLERGMRIHRYCLLALEKAAETVDEPREVKVIVDAAGIAIDSIRRIRGLDGSSSDDSQVIHSKIEQLVTSRQAALAGLTDEELDRLESIVLKLQQPTPPQPEPPGGGLVH